MSHAGSKHEEEAFVLEAVQCVLNGDINAFSIIVKAHEKLIAADLGRRLPAQDIQEVAQDTFLRAYRSLGSFRKEAPFRIWLLRIARYAALDFWRRKYRRKDVPFADLDAAAWHTAEADRQSNEREQQKDREAEERARERLNAALLHLTPDDRAVITLIELEGFPMKAAAEQLSCSLSSIKVRAFRARHRLKRILEQPLREKDEIR
ncbi:MAG: sigma-70 family RNA polymerase sigma factor [Verrucomicrobiota bacterium]|jgi:RNA polymerase sigma-70 factor (ECF subfamily)|nr:sigma-70 family RNA polymerase sigma factor [Verrucomicrobiota bacterium]